MKLAIVGGRDFDDYSLMWTVVNSIYRVNSNTSRFFSLVSGGANGADKLAERYAMDEGFKIEVFKPNWELHGKSAGFKRNVQIVDACDQLIAFWDGVSKGTKHSIDLAKKAGKLYKVVYYV